MEVIVMADQRFRTWYLQIVKVDLFYHGVRLKNADQPLGSRLIISRLKIFYWYMTAIDPQGADIDLETIKMTFMRIEVAATCQADVSDAKLPVVACLPFPFYE